MKRLFTRILERVGKRVSPFSPLPFADLVFCLFVDFTINQGEKMSM